RSPSDTSALCLYASWLAAGPAQFGTPGVGLGAERRNALVHRCGFHHRTGRQDRGPLRLPRLAGRIMRKQNLAWVARGHGYAKMRRRSIAIEEVIRPRPLWTPKLQAN